jgi:hypothetical protein
MTLTEFVDSKLAIALDYRGLSKYNPVEIVVEGNGHTFVVLVSHLEPDTLTVPYNVSWIMSDPEHPDYKVLMRRVDAENYDGNGYRGSWAVLSTVETIFEEPQFFKKDSDPILGEVEQFRPPIATDKAYGGFFVSHVAAGSELAPVVVETSDPRMSNARPPKTHSHVQTPATMLSAGDSLEKYVNISTVNDPVAGQMLFVTGTDGDGNYVGEWKYPTAEFPYIGPVPVSLDVIGPLVPVLGGTNHVLRADVLMDDDTTLNSVKAVWTLGNNAEWAQINAATGVFKAGLVAVDTPVTVRATWTHVDSGEVVFKDYIITIIGDPSLVILDFISIGGPTEIQKSETGTYPVTAHYTDGSTAVVTPNVYESSNSAAGTFSNGVLTPRSSQIGDLSTRLTATYTANGITRTAFIDVTVKDPAIYPATITINGPVQVDQDDSITLLAHVVFTDGSEADVNTAAWSVVSTVFATITTPAGVLTAKPLTTPGSKSVTVNVSFTQNGVTKTASKAIAIADTKNWPTTAQVLGKTTVAPSATETYTYEVTYTDGSKVLKTPVWSSSDETKMTIDAATGVATYNTIESTVTVRAVYTEDGINLNANKVVTIAVPPVVVPEMRIGSAMFANRLFTGGPIASEITPEEAEYDVIADPSPYGRPYDHWAGFAEFAADKMTQTVTTVDGTTPVSVTVDNGEYVYIMWPKSKGSAIVTLLQPGDFNEIMGGVLYRNEILGNSDGLPGYDPNLPKFVEVMYDDGTGEIPWIVVRADDTPNATQTFTYKISYVP